MPLKVAGLMAQVPQSHPLHHRVAGSVVVYAKHDAVWSVLSDFHRVDRWSQLIVRVERIGDIASGVGAARRCQLDGLGTIDEVVTVWDAPDRLGYRVSALGPIASSESLWQLKRESSDRTRVDLSLRYRMRFGVIGALLNRTIVRARLERSLHRALRLLRQYVESLDGANPRTPNQGSNEHAPPNRASDSAAREA